MDLESHKSRLDQINKRFQKEDIQGKEKMERRK
jgi:hypothetical protein